MNYRTIKLIAVAVIVVAFMAGVVGSTLSGGSSSTTHAMPDGSTMDGGGMP